LLINTEHRFSGSRRLDPNRITPLGAELAVYNEDFVDARFCNLRLCHNKEDDEFTCGIIHLAKVFVGLEYYTISLTLVEK
jgi:hypothetical protein